MRILTHVNCEILTHVLGKNCQFLHACVQSLKSSQFHPKSCLCLNFKKLILQIDFEFHTFHNKLLIYVPFLT